MELLRQMKSFNTLVIMILFVILPVSKANSACVHDTNQENKGTCYADFTEHPDGTVTVHSYNCEVPKPREGGYPPIHNCVLGLGDNEGGNDGLPQLNPGL